jgi:iron-sulfur cluster assembly accessory protein
MSISITSSARAQLVSLIKRMHKHIVFGCKSGGCAGFEYKWSYEETAGVSPILLADPYTLSVCPLSEVFVIGTEIDWTEHDFNTGFIYRNPQSVQSCGCSLSFHPVDSELFLQKYIAHSSNK